MDGMGGHEIRIRPDEQDTPGDTPATVPAQAAPAEALSADPDPDPEPDPDSDPEPPEHWRYRRHLDALAAAGRTGEEAEAATVAEVLRDPDPVMAESAVVYHLDRRAWQLLDEEAFPGWARAMTAVITGRAFVERRLREWTLLRAVDGGGAWSAEELTAASDWCQRTAAQSLASHDALALLAEAGRTRRVRNAATQRLRRGVQG
jgi:hypothetical protein